MPNTNVKMKDIEGLLPAVDRRQVNKPFLLYARNVLHDVEGPFSAFGNRVTNIKPFVHPENFASFQVEDRYFYLMNDGVYEYNPLTRTFLPRFTFTGDLEDTLWPWTMAQVANDYFFCKKGIGVLRYNDNSQIWELLSDPFLPENPCAVTEARGRLVILGDVIYSWSAFGDGTDITPDLVTGAGFASTNLIGGYSITVASTANGFTVYTSKGAIKVVYSGGQTVFRHDVLSRKLILLNGHCIVNLDSKEHIVLTNVGLFKTDGVVFQPYNPLFSDYLVRKEIPNFSETRDDNFRLSYDRVNERIYLSVGFSSETIRHYQRAFVIDLRLERIGQFNWPHHGFGIIQFEARSSLRERWGYLDEAGFFRAFQGETYRETEVEGPLTVQWSPVVQFEAQLAAGTWVMPCVSQITSYDPNNFANLAAGFYLNVPNINHDFFNIVEDWLVDVGDEDWMLLTDEEDYMEDMAESIAPYRPEIASIDAGLQVGLLRLEQQRYPDEIGNVTDMTLSIDNVAPEDDVEDYMAADNVGTEDWMTIVAQEDWGYGGASGQFFEAILFGTHDGSTEFCRADEDPVPMGEKQLFYPVFTMGVFHYLQLEAANVNETFHLKLLELSGNVAGRLH